MTTNPQLKNRDIHRKVRRFLKKLIQGDTRIASQKLESVRIELRDRCKKDLWFLCYSGLNMRDTNSKLHREMAKTWVAREKKLYTLWQCPRFHLKTSMWVIGDTIREGLIDPNQTQALISAKLDNVTSILKDIRMVFEVNEVMRWLFPEYCHDLADKDTKRRCSWTSEKVDWPCRSKWVKESSLEVMSVGSSMVSKHFDILRFDDAVNDDNTNTVAECEKTYKWFRDAWQLRVSPLSRMRITGTPWHFGDFYTREIEREKKRREAGKKAHLLVYRRPCYNKQGDAIWPERMGLEELADTKELIGSYQFACNFELNPVPEGTAVFKRSNINRCHELEIPGNLVHFIAVDLSEEDSNTPDHTAIIVVGLNEYGRWYVRELDRGKYHPLSLMEKIAHLSNKYNVELVGIETTGFQKTIYKEYLRWSHKNKINVPWVEMKRGKQHKNLRIRAMQPIFERGDFWVVDGLMHYSALEEELTTFDKGRSDDIIDALASIQELYYDAPEKVMEQIEPTSINAIYGDLTKMIDEEEEYWNEESELFDMEELELAELY